MLCESHNYLDCLLIKPHSHNLTEEINVSPSFLTGGSNCVLPSDNKLVSLNVDTISNVYPLNTTRK